MYRLLRTVAAMLLLAAVAAPARAQTLTGTISGVIKDEQGAVLPGVTVTLAGKQGSRTTVTDTSGLYRFPGLESGAYSVTADLSGFSKAGRNEIQVSPGNDLGIDLVMKVGSLTETINVTGQSPVVDVKSSATGNTI